MWDTLMMVMSTHLSHHVILLASYCTSPRVQLRAKYPLRMMLRIYDVVIKKNRKLVFQINNPISIDGISLSGIHPGKNVASKFAW